MDMSDYQHRAARTAVYPGQGTTDGLAYVALGLVGEAGEIANKVKKVLRDDAGELTPERRKAIADELGDVLWYCAQIATELDRALGIVAERNLDKLEARKESGTLHGDGDNR